MTTIEGFNAYLIKNGININLNEYIKELAIRYYNIDITELIDAIGTEGFLVTDSLLKECGLTQAQINSSIRKLKLVEDKDYTKDMKFTYECTCAIIKSNDESTKVETMLRDIVCLYIVYQRDFDVNISSKLNEIMKCINSINFELLNIRDELSGEIDALREELHTNTLTLQKYVPTHKLNH